MGRHSCCYKQKLKKGLWSPEEDEKLVKHITTYGHGCWSSVPKQAGLQRCGKSCRLRWINYLRPDLKRGTFSQQEENIIVELHAAMGNRWSQIAAQLPGRTDNEIKNMWNSSIKKKLMSRSINANTHKLLDNTKAQEEITPTKHEKTFAQEPAPPMVQAKDEYLADKSSSKNSATQHKQFISGQFAASKGSPAKEISYFPFPHSTYTPTPDCGSNQTTSLGKSVYPNPPLWINQSCHLFNTNPDINSNTIINQVSSFSSSIPSLKPEFSILSDDPQPGFQYWEQGESCSSRASSDISNSGIEFQSNSLLDGDILPWSELMMDKDAQMRLSKEPEDLKWSEYLLGAMRMSSVAQTQSQVLYGDVKQENMFTLQGLSTWHDNQQQQLQAPDMYSKALHGQLSL